MPIEETLIGKLRREYRPRIPKLLEKIKNISFDQGEKTTSLGDSSEIQKLFPLTYGAPIIFGKDDQKSREYNSIKIGVVLSGGQASGGHNVICGLFDAMKSLNPESQLIGFLGGPKGIIKNKFKKLDKNVIDKYRNTGGFDMIASGRDKIETDEQMELALKTANSNNLDGLVIIGGDDSNTNASVLAEFFKKNASKCCVVGVPKTIDGDLQNDYIEISFGFDTAVKTYSEMISNICRDAISAEKTWHFIKLMGRDASQVTLDCALQTHPNIALIGEEIEAEESLLSDIADYICDIIMKRSEMGKNYGVILIPEGVITFIPSMRTLINELNDLLKQGSEYLKEIDTMEDISDKINYIKSILIKKSRTLSEAFNILPKDIKAQLLLERDPHGNVQISQVPTEQLFIQICEKRLNERQFKGSFRPQGHFFGYDGRAGYPSNFDANYAYSLGMVAALLIGNRYNGYMTRVYNLENNVNEWNIGAIPITMLLNIETRHGKPKPVIRKCLVDINDNKFHYFSKYRGNWTIDDSYRYIGPIQFYGPSDLVDEPPMNLLLKKTGNIIWPVKKII